MSKSKSPLSKEFIQLVTEMSEAEIEVLAILLFSLNHSNKPTDAHTPLGWARYFLHTLREMRDGGMFRGETQAEQRAILDSWIETAAQNVADLEKSQD